MKNILLIFVSSIIILTMNLHAEKLNFSKRNDLNKKRFDRLENNMNKFKNKFKTIMEKTPINEQMELCLGIQEQIQTEFNSKLPKNEYVKRISLTASNKINQANKIDKRIIKGFQSFPNKKYLYVTGWDKDILYKPIKIEKSCLRCHGENISKTDEEILYTIYDNKEFKHDFKEGDLIGVLKSFSRRF